MCKTLVTRLVVYHPLLNTVFVAVSISMQKPELEFVKKLFINNKLTILSEVKSLLRTSYYIILLLCLINIPLYKSSDMPAAEEELAEAADSPQTKAERELEIFVSTETPGPRIVDLTVRNRWKKAVDEV